MRMLQLSCLALLIGMLALTWTFGAPVWLSGLLAFAVVALLAGLEIRHYRRTGEACGACVRGSGVAASMLVAGALVFSAAPGHALPVTDLSPKGCALMPVDCELLIENSVMYNAVYDGTSTMYSLPKRSIRYRLARWLHAYVYDLKSCEKPKEKVRQIIGGIESFDQTYDILAPIHAVPGSVCYIRKSAS